MFLMLGSCLLFFQAAESPAQFSSNPSFGIVMTKRKVLLKRKLAPIYNASGKTIVIAMAKTKEAPEVEIALEKELTQNDSTIHVGGLRPDLLIECQVSHYTEPRYVTVGGVRRLKPAPYGGSISSLPDVGNGLEACDQIGHGFVPAFEVVSRTSNASNGSKLFGLKLPSSSANTTALKPADNSAAEAHGTMVTMVARQMATYLVNTQETLDVRWRLAEL